MTNLHKNPAPRKATHKGNVVEFGRERRAHDGVDLKAAQRFLDLLGAKRCTLQTIDDNAARKDSQSRERRWRRKRIRVPGSAGKRPLSNMVFLMTLRRMKLDVTAHGFRSSFRDWAAEQTNFPREVREIALAHAVEDKVEAAYRRGDLFAKRRELMTAWERFAALAPEHRRG